MAFHFQFQLHGSVAKILTTILYAAAAVSFSLSYVGGDSDDTVNSRVERQALLESGGDNAEVCMVFCYADLSEELETNGYSFDDIEEPWNISNFTRMCQIVRKGLSCMDTCGPSNMKKLLTPVANAYKFMCVDKYRAFARSMPCIGRLRPYVDKVCNSKCEGDLKPLQNEVKEMLQGFLIVDKRKLFQKGTKFCQQVECNLKCSQPILVKYCKKAAEVTKNFLAKAFKAFEATMKQNFNGTWPKTCDKMMAFF